MNAALWFILMALLAAVFAAPARAQEKVTSPNAQVAHLGLHGVFTIDMQELAAKDPRNPRRIAFTEMTRASFFDDVDGKTPIARDCQDVYRGAAGDPYYYPERSKWSIWELLELTGGETSSRKFSFVIVTAPHGDPVHMHLRYGDESSSFQRLLAISTQGPEDKTKLDPWWSVYCAEGKSRCDR